MKLVTGRVRIIRGFVAVGIYKIGNTSELELRIVTSFTLCRDPTNTQDALQGKRAGAHMPSRA